jgi:hypothetical protein
LIQAFKEFPYFPQFKFSGIAASTRNQVQLLIPHNIAVYGIAISASELPETDYYEYRLQFQDYESGETLFDEPIFAFNIQTDCRTYPPPWGKDGPGNGGAFRLPSKWFLRKNQKIICKLDTFADSETEDYNVTLLAYTTDVDPNPGVQPFIYSYPMRMGYQDNVGSGGQTSVNFNQQVTNTLAKPMQHDFELYAITLDPVGTGGFLGTPTFSFQISWPGKKLADRMIIDGCWGGGSDFGQGDSVLVGTRLIDDEIWQYVFPRPEHICKGQIVRVDISPAPTYLNSDQIHTAFNEEVCMALIGNHYA